MFLLCLCSLVLVRPMGTPLSWHLSFFTCTHYFFLRFCLFSEKGREKEGKKHQCVVASHAPPMGDLACNPGMCPNRELNQRAFGWQAGAQSTEPYQAGLYPSFLNTSLGKFCAFLIPDLQSPISPKNWFFLVENGCLEAEIRVLDALTTIGELWLPGLVNVYIRYGIYVCTHTHIAVYI